EPFAIASVEDAKRGAGLQAQHVAKVMVLRLRKLDRSALGEIGLDEKPAGAKVLSAHAVLILHRPRGLDAASWRQVFPKASQKPRAGRASCIEPPASSLFGIEPLWHRASCIAPQVIRSRRRDRPRPQLCLFFL